MLQELDDFYEYYGAQTDKGAEAVVCAISDVLSLFPNHVAPAAQWTCLGIKTLNNIYHDKTLKNTARLQWMTNSENLNFDDPNFVTVDGVWDPNTETYLFYTDTIPQEQLFDGSITVSFISESNEVPIYEFISYDPNFTEIGNKHLALDNISPYGDINGDGTTNFKDFAILANHYYEFGSYTDRREGTDLNRDEYIDHKDLFILAQNWLWQASWYSE